MHRQSTWASLLLSGCAHSSLSPVGDRIQQESRAGTFPTFHAEAMRARLDPFFDSFGPEWGEIWRLSGVIHAAARDQTLYHRASGQADRAIGAPPGLHTSFRVGSVTKQFTAVGVLALVDAGKLRLQERICDLLPDYVGANPHATVHQLLNHTAGLPSYTDVPAIMSAREHPHTPEQLIAATVDADALFPPGTAWAYSNSGYILLGMIIEVRSGETYAHYMETLFQRGGLERTTVGDAPHVEDRARGYIHAGERIQPAPDIDLSVAWSAGGIRSTVSDLILWDKALRSGLLSPRALEILTRPSPHGSPYGPYACGWFLEEIHGKTAFMHGGGIEGFTTFFIRVPVDELVVVAWQNTNVVPSDQLARPLLELAYGGSPLTRTQEPYA